MNQAKSGGDLFNSATPERFEPDTGHRNTFAARVKGNAIIVNLRQPGAYDVARSGVAQLAILLHQYVRGNLFLTPGYGHRDPRGKRERACNAQSI